MNAALMPPPTSVAASFTMPGSPEVARLSAVRPVVCQ
jgi:hypothetical protein